MGINLLKETKHQNAMYRIEQQLKILLHELMDFFIYFTDSMLNIVRNKDRRDKTHHHHPTKVKSAVY